MDNIRFLIASNNKKKITELREIIEPLGIKIISPDDVGGISEVEETGQTFEENAILKAVEISKLTGEFVFADDSGLMVEALDGRPGVYSARYAGKNATDSDRINKLLDEMKSHKNRRAKFVCVIAICSPNNQIRTYKGEVHGNIIYAPKGTMGFGYDPIFVPNGYNKTFAKLPSDIKNKISHRANALSKAVADLTDFVNSVKC